MMISLSVALLGVAQAVQQIPLCLTSFEVGIKDPQRPAHPYLLRPWGLRSAQLSTEHLACAGRAERELIYMDDFVREPFVALCTFGQTVPAHASRSATASQFAF